MNKVLPKFALLLAAALLAPCSHARDLSPDAVLSAINSEVIEILKHDKEMQPGGLANVNDLIETKILPLFDFPRMTQVVLARNWRLASAEQQAMLIAEFKTLLVRTYPAALSMYRDQVIEFKRTHMSAGGTEVRVKSEVKKPGMERMPLDYDMEKTPAGWKVYDIKMGGVSLIAVYREAFADAVREMGVDGLIKSLSDKNRQLDSGAKPANTTFRDQSRIMFAMLQSALQGRR